jgi:hypothetical protein
MSLRIGCGSMAKQPEFQITFTTTGTFFLSSSSPHMRPPVAERLPTGEWIVTMPVHINVIQVALIDQEIYAVNGTHRLADAVRFGLTRVPALVVEPQSAREISVRLGVDGFDLEELVRDKRPPRMGEFFGPAAIRMQTDRMLYGATVKFVT